MTSPIDVMLDRLEWTPTGAAVPTDGIPVATHEGVLEVGGIRLRVSRLSDDRRVINADDLAALFAVAGEGGGR